MSWAKIFFQPLEKPFKGFFLGRDLAFPEFFRINSASYYFGYDGTAALIFNFSALCGIDNCALYS